MKGKILLYGGVFGILFFGAMLDSPFWQLPLLLLMLSLAVAVKGYRSLDIEKFINERGLMEHGTDLSRIERRREETFRNWVRSPKMGDRF